MMIRLYIQILPIWVFGHQAENLTFFFLMVVLVGTQFEKEAVVVISFIFDMIIPTSSLCWWNIKKKSSVHPKPMG